MVYKVLSFHYDSTNWTKTLDKNKTANKQVFHTIIPDPVCLFVDIVPFPINHSLLYFISYIDDEEDNTEVSQIFY